MLKGLKKNYTNCALEDECGRSHCQDCSCNTAFLENALNLTTDKMKENFYKRVRQHWIEIGKIK